MVIPLSIIAQKTFIKPASSTRSAPEGFSILERWNRTVSSTHSGTRRHPFQSAPNPVATGVERRKSTGWESASTRTPISTFCPRHRRHAILGNRVVRSQGRQRRANRQPKTPNNVPGFFHPGRTQIRPGAVPITGASFRSIPPELPYAFPTTLSRHNSSGNLVHLPTR